jgi:L-ascorbate metabolism protein UlaG (beta-lactamase superfamily)
MWWADHVQITRIGHSCLLVETGGARLLVDPGSFTPGWEELSGLDAVFVTHEHPDHLDRDRLPALLERNPQARLITEPGVAGQLSGAVRRDVEALEAGATTTVGAVTVSGVGGRHAVIHEDIARIGNVGLLFAADGEPTLFHPGDMIDTVPQGVDVLAVPLNAPWCAAKETASFLRAVAAPAALPIHDAMLSPAGRATYLRVLGGLLPDGTEFADAPDGTTISRP